MTAHLKASSPPQRAMALEAEIGPDSRRTGHGKPLSTGIVLDKRNRRVVLQALAAGRQYGLRVAQQALDQLADELRVTREEREALRSRLRSAFEMLDAADKLIALHERCDQPTLH